MTNDDDTLLRSASAIRTKPPDVLVDLRRLLRRLHVQSTGRPISGPGPTGAFPEGLLEDVPPVVLEANVLRNDIGYACEHDQRTALVNAGNVRVLRLFATGHVVEEVEEYCQQWAVERGVAPTTSIERWRVE